MIRSKTILTSVVLTFLIAMLCCAWKVDAQQIAAYTDHTLAVCPNGNVLAWGNNEHGQLGDGTTTNQSYPVPVHGLEHVSGVYADWRQSYAITEDGSVWAWGSNASNLLNIDEEDHDFKPVRVEGLPNIKQLAVGNFYVLALAEDGTVWGWGEDDNGHIGVGTAFVEYNEPVQTHNLDNVESIYTNSRSSHALKADGTLWSWGNNRHGVLGLGTDADYISEPQQVQGINNIQQVDVTYWHVLALADDGTVWSWGRNEQGQLGDGTETNRNEPYHVAELSGVEKVGVTPTSSYAFKEDGTIWSWGNNFNSNLGDGSNERRTSPVQVQNINDAIFFMPMRRGGLVIRMDSSIWAWGANFSGQLGDGSTTSSNVPVEITGLPHGTVFPQSGTTYRSFHRNIFALDPEGRLWGWGENASGQLGNGTTDMQVDPDTVRGYPDPLPPPEIEGESTPDSGISYDYFTHSLPEGYDYHWSVPEDWEIVSGQGSDFITVISGNANGEVCVVADNGCSISDRVCQYVRADLSIARDTTLCEGDIFKPEIHLFEGEEAEWSTGETGSSINISESGTYYVNVKSDEGMISDTFEVTFAPRPTVYIGPDSAFCGEIDYLIEPKTDGQYFEWNTGETTKTLHVDEEGTYSLRVEDEKSCSNADTVELLVMEYPDELEEDSLLVCEEEATLDAGNPGAKYEWSTGETTQTITVTESGTYSVVIDNGFCSIEDNVHVSLYDDKECEELLIWIPNAFAPAGKNKRFKPVYEGLEEFEMQIYDRWGSFIYETDDAVQGWDGKVNGDRVPAGVYLYIIRATGTDGSVYRDSGTVTVVY